MNQYRCETCEHMKTHTSKGGLPFEERCEVSGYPPRDKIFENKLACVGCASHSDFRSGWDTVLDEVLQLPQRREQPNGSMYIYVNDVKELRQKVGD